MKCKSITSVGAKTYGEALDRLPKLGTICDGKRLFSRGVKLVEGFRHWYVATLDWQPIKVRWHNLGSIKVRRWIKAVRI